MIAAWLLRGRGRRAVKPAPFRYAAPASLREALELLGANEDAKPLAGGQSLVPMLNFRLARPELLVDLNPLAGELGGITVTADGTLAVGALTRHAELERSAAVAAGWPSLVDAIRLVGHAAIRSRGRSGVRSPMPIPTPSCPSC